MKTSPTLHSELDGLRSRALVVGGVFLLISAAGWLWNPDAFFRSYLTAYLFWIGISLGSLAILMLHHMVGGAWGFVIRRLLEAAAGTIPLMAALFLPLLLGLHNLYEWTHEDVVATDEILQHKAAYLNVPFFIVRAAIYFAIWLFLIWILNKRSLQQDQTGDPGLTRRLQLVSGPGLVLYGATITFCSVDWAMSLEPHWFSTLYGLLFIVGQALSTMAFAVLALRLFYHHEPLATVVSAKNFHDLGNLLLAFVMLWAYLSFSQYLIVWSGNIPEEIPWYLHRTRGGWQYVALFLVVFHFALPFVLLLSRTTKKKARALAVLAVSLLFLRYVDLFFVVVPGTPHNAGFNVQWTDPAALIGMGGLWVWLFAARLKQKPLLPVNDPRLAEAFDREVMEHG